MRTVDTTDNAVRFTTEWDGIRRYVFIEHDLVEQDAGRPLCRQEAVDFVREHLARYRERALAQHGVGNPIQAVELTRAVEC